ncbi:DUF6600 domain-containing protein [Aromatoleum toluclasticum]|uniref:DUF6600 domain-containing protein n=1 Tax=Aromatoleum toluclasticum TaxID=92003 RepID=UPI00037DE088|nr:DUF6600 domain-containing protein [Aromatoleum toluclasticum]
MNTPSLRLRILVLLAGIAILLFSGWAGADPPSRIARLAYIAGAVSLSPAGDNDWFEASVNRPLTTGDRLWVDAGARAELQTGGALVRMKAGTGASILNLDDRTTQLQLTQGTLNVRVRRLAPGEIFEVDTPNLAFTLRKPGAYRIEVDADNDATTIFVRQGQGEVYGEDAAYVIDPRQPYRFTGTGLREYEYVDVPRPDDFDRWASSRDRRYDDSRSVRYVSEDVVGYQELDEYGDWRDDPTYGSVWYPTRVAVGWVPYRDGHWAWIDPWGWTWVDDAPWGFAVSHYGRWAYLGGTWAWVPGPVRSRAYYAPALVVFVGGGNFQLTISSGPVGGVAWFPLAPREVYRPVYQVSRNYFENINRSNTVINTTVINNYYNNTNVTTVVHANRTVEGAVVAVPTTAFVQSQPVSRSAVRVSREVVGSAPLALAAPIAPTEKSIRGAASQGGKPPPRAFERGVVARTAPPPAPIGFAAQQQQLNARQGKPLDEAERMELKRAATVPAPAVKVVAPKQEAPPTVQPPQAGFGAKAGDARGQSEQRGRGEERGQPAAPQQEPSGRAAQPPLAPQQATPAAPEAQPRDIRGRPERRGDDGQRGRVDERGNDEQRGRTAAPRPVEPEPAAPRVTPAVPPNPATRTRPVEPAVPATPTEPAAQVPEPRRKSEQREEREPRRERPQREPAIAPSPARGAPQPEVAPQRATPQTPDVQSREPRDEEPKPAQGRGRNKNKDSEEQQEDNRR